MKVSRSAIGAVMVLGGLSTKEAAAQLGITPSSVSHACRQYGVRRFNAGHRSGSRSSQALGLVLSQGYSQREAANYLGISTACVAASMRRYRDAVQYHHDQVGELASC